MSDTNATLTDDEHKECPYCAEVIKKKAVLCRYCKSDLTAPDSANISPDSTSHNQDNDGKDAIEKWNRISRGLESQGPPQSAYGYQGHQEETGEAALICQHCQQRGNVTTRQVKVKTGFSTGKAAFAVVTLGTSTLATGLAKKGYITKARCASCGSEWEF